MPFSRSVARKKVANSSDEARILEVRRNVVRRSSPSNTPANTWLLPMSSVSSIALPAPGKRDVVDEANTAKKGGSQAPAPVFLDVIHFEALGLKRCPCVRGRRRRSEDAVDVWRLLAGFRRQQRVARAFREAGRIANSRARDDFGGDEELSHHVGDHLQLLVILLSEIGAVRAHQTE